MTGLFIAIANMKGGVGKTTTVVSLAEALAADDTSKSVLVVDIDPQASASLCLAGDSKLSQSITRGKTLSDILDYKIFYPNRNFNINDYICPDVTLTTHNRRKLSVSLIPCQPEMRLFERKIMRGLTKKGISIDTIEDLFMDIFKNEFFALKNEYDYIIFDCPPSISMFSEVAIRSSDLLIVPTIPDRISNFGLNAFCAIWDDGISSLASPPTPTVLITREQQTVQHRQMIARLEAEASARDPAFRLFRARVPQNAQLANALTCGVVQTFSKKYGPVVGSVLEELVSEIKGRPATYERAPRQTAISP